MSSFGFELISYFAMLPDLSYSGRERSIWALEKYLINLHMLTFTLNLNCHSSLQIAFSIMSWEREWSVFPLPSPQF